MIDPWLLAIPLGVAIILLMRLALLCRPQGLRKTNPALPGCGWQLVYSDSHSPGRLLTDHRHQLQGKPDMIYAKGRRMCPVELKSGKIGEAEQPRDGDLMQLAVYFLLIEAEFGIRARNGRIIYKDSMFIVSNNKALRQQLLRTLSAMRQMLDEPGQAVEAEQSFVKCRHCPCRDTVCL
jgi:CRISPR-associated exonuclease Cas4